MSENFSTLIENFKSKEIEIKNEQQSKSKLGTKNLNKTNSSKLFEEYSNILKNIKSKISESGLSEIELNKRKDLYKELNDSYTATLKQLDIPKENKSDNENRPVTQNEYMKIKEEKFKSIVCLYRTGRDFGANWRYYEGYKEDYI
jgi:hypothetical protein